MNANCTYVFLKLKLNSPILLISISPRLEVHLFFLYHFLQGNNYVFMNQPNAFAFFEKKKKLN